MTYRKKLIEVALPLDAINAASSHEKDVHVGLPANLHTWWARKPLAASRAVLFASLIDDPESTDAPKALLDAIDRLLPSASRERSRRDRLFEYIAELAKWENTTNEKILDIARELVHAATGDNPPPFLDPFCGGGSIPLEAQRLGLQAYASDLNPVAVLITMALVELPGKFAGRPPVNPDANAHLDQGAQWKGTAGLVADVRYYAEWMRIRVQEKIGHLYPRGPNGEAIIAWLWARSVECANPACRTHLPLAHSFWLSKHRRNEAWLEPTAEHDNRRISFEVRTSGRPVVDGTVSRTGAHCLSCGHSMGFDYIADQSRERRIRLQALSAVVEGVNGRQYLAPTEALAQGTGSDTPAFVLNTALPEQALGFRVQRYGITRHDDLFTDRQRTVIAAFSEMVSEASSKVLEHSGGDDDYALAVTVYLALAVDRLAQTNNTLVRWLTRPSGPSKGTPAFDRPTVSMVWGFSEGNAFGRSVGSWDAAISNVAGALANLPGGPPCSVRQLDAAASGQDISQALVVTDPPYYDNIGYANLSDFFYVWLRTSLGKLIPNLFSTVLTPKANELCADPGRYGGDINEARKRFEQGLREAFETLTDVAAPDYPLSLFYAFKQSEVRDGDVTAISTGWDTMLSGLVGARLSVVGTWPIRSDSPGRLRAIDSNALASSIVLVCRPRPKNAPMATFKQFQSELSRELPTALSIMTGRDREDHSEPWVDPIDLRQAAIGPGMAVYSRYNRVQKADGSALSVREALQEINEAIDAYFDEMEGELDRDTRFCSQWYRESGFKDGAYGRAEVLAQAMNVGVEALGARGLLQARGGKVRLLHPSDYRAEMPAGPSIWELCHRLVGALEDGEETAARLYNAMPGLAEEARDLAYRLYLEAEKKNRAEDALGYNALVASWTDVRRKATELREESQGALL